MPQAARTPPIIIIGMHRSGTSLLTRLLAQMGLFVGHSLDANAEALFFVKLNKWLLRQSGGAWDHPEHFQAVVQHEQARALSVDYLRHMLASPRVVSYSGLGRSLRYGSPFAFPFPWGWKDPRTTFTLPLWLDVFPEARVIHVFRHGVDVAYSLQKREQSALARYRAGYERQKRRRRYWLLPRRYGFQQSFRVLSLEGGFSLWEAYLDQARQMHAEARVPFLEMQYEALLQQPEPMLRQAAEFCQLPVTEKTLKRLSDDVQADRAFAYLNMPDLRAFAQQVQQRLALRGY